MEGVPGGHLATGFDQSPADRLVAHQELDSVFHMFLTVLLKSQKSAPQHRFAVIRF